MAAREDTLITAVDVGSAKTCALVAEIRDGALRYRGHGVVPSSGVRKGLIVELDKAAGAVARAVEAAERAADAQIESAVIGVGGPHLRGVNSRGGIQLGQRLREITTGEIRNAVDRARSVSLPPDRTVLHLLPQEFILDDQAGIHDPLGMIGNRLEVNLHMVTASTGATQSVVTAANRASIEVTDTIYEGLAAAEAVLTADERELGACLIDIGAGSTEMIVFFEGSVAATAALPIGGDHFTNDLAVCFRTPLAEAEKIKRMFGCCVVTSVPEGNEVEVPGAGDRGSRLVSQREIAEVLEPRARELFQLVRETLREGGVLDALGAGCVLVGGGAHLAGLHDTAESALRAQVRVGAPAPLAGMPAALADAGFAAAVGMVLYAYRTRGTRAEQEHGLRARLRSIFASTAGV